MEVMVISDTHIHPYARFATTLSNGMNSRSKQILDAVQEAFEFAKNHAIPEIWHLGDVFHVPGRIEVREFNAFYEMLADVNKAGVRVTLIAGNHDYVSKASAENSLKALRSVAKVVWDQVEEMAVGGVPVTFVPWIVWDKFKGGGRGVCVGHLPVEGAKADSSEYVPSGGLSVKVFDDYDITLLGHYHRRQKVGGKVWYIGSLVAHDFGETGSEKGFAVLDLSTLKLRFIETSAPRFYTVSSRMELEEVVKHPGSYVRVDDLSPGDEEKVREILANMRAVVFTRKTEDRTEARLPIEEDTPLREVIDKYIELSLIHI